MTSTGVTWWLIASLVVLAADVSLTAYIIVTEHRIPWPGLITSVALFGALVWTVWEAARYRGRHE